MRLAARTDLAADAATLYRALTDGAWLESEARRAGATVRRTAEAEGAAGGAIGPGTTWEIDVEVRGRRRHLVSRVVAAEPGRLLSAAGEMAALASLVEVRLTALSPRLTRMAVVLELQPRTLPARLMIQTLRLGRSRLQARFERRLASLGRRLCDHGRG